MTPRARSATAAVALTLGLAGVAALQPRPPEPTPAIGPPRLPDPRLTPGAVVPGVTRVQTCDPAWTRRSRNVPESMKVAVFRAYGIDPTPENRRLYEIDHRCPVSLAGESSARNLWPEPWDGPYGARQKDRLEALLYRKVCRGEIGLAEAQRAFLGDWWAAFRDHLGDPESPRYGAGPGGDDDGDTEGFDRPTPNEDRP